MDADPHLLLIVHELRRPLSVIRGYSELAVGGDLQGEALVQAHRLIFAAAVELEDLLGRVLLSARLDSGGADAEPHWFDVAELVHEAAAGLAEVQVKAAPGLVEAHADREQVAWIMSNLLRNALAYSEEGPVEVAIRPGPPVQVVIRDHGRGIAAADQARVFEPFQRATATEGGLGLGLAISRQLAELNHGELVLEESELGGGSTFILSLPGAGVRRSRSPRGGFSTAAAIG